MTSPQQGSSTEDERALVELCLTGDELGIRTLIGRFQGSLFGLCYRMLGHREDAEDVVQDVFLRVFRHLERWDGARPLKPWLLTIACNRCKTVLEKRARKPTPAAYVPELAVQEPVSTLREDLAEELQIALEKLRGDYRTCFILFHQQKLSISEIAVVLESPEGTVKTWLHRARKELAEHLQRRGIGPESCYELQKI